MKYYTEGEALDKVLGKKGSNITFATMAKIFRAMGISASFEMAGIGKVALW